MRLRRARGAPRGRIEIIPMIDVMFFLLVTFMLASLSMQHLHALAVALPRGAAEPLATGRAPLTLTVTRDGKLLVDHTPVTLDGLPAALKPRLSGPDPGLVVNADAAARRAAVLASIGAE